MARELYGLEATVRPLPGERDLNFALQANGSRYVLKVHRPGADLALEDAVLEHLAEEQAVPRLAGPTKTHDGRTVRLLSWLDGTPWADEPGDLAELGRTVARVDQALASFTHPAMHREHPWKATGVRNDLPHQVIHNDANEHNVLVA